MGRFPKDCDGVSVWCWEVGLRQNVVFIINQYARLHAVPSPFQAFKGERKTGQPLNLVYL